MNQFRLLTVGCCFLLTFVSVPRLTQNTDSTQDRSSQPISDSSVTLPPGTVISVRMTDEVNSNRNHAGDMFTGTVDPSVFVQDHVVIPRGTEAHIQMVDAKKVATCRISAFSQASRNSESVAGSILAAATACFSRERRQLLWPWVCELIICGQSLATAAQLNSRPAELRLQF